MSTAVRSIFRRSFMATTLVLVVAVPAALAQIKTEIIEKYRAELQKQSTDPVMKRERGTQSEDWLFTLPEGVTSRQVTFYSDLAPCYARIFFPKGFSDCCCLGVDLKFEVDVFEVKGDCVGGNTHLPTGSLFVVTLDQ